MPRKSQKFLRFLEFGLVPTEVLPGQPVQLSMSREAANLAGKGRGGQGFFLQERGRVGPPVSNR